MKEVPHQQSRGISKDALPPSYWHLRYMCQTWKTVEIHILHIANAIVYAIIMSNGRPFTSYTIEKVIGNGSLVQIQRGPATVIDRMLGLKSGRLPSNFV